MAKCSREFRLLLCLAVFVGSSTSIKVLRSTLTLEEDGTAISGAKLIDNRKVKVADITLCIRFNFKLLGGYEGRSQLIHIEDWKDRPKDNDFNLLWFDASFPYSFFGFGHPRAHGSYKSYLLRDPLMSGFEVWATNRWSHVCLSYEKATGHLRVVKDGRPLNIDYPDPEMTKVDIPTDFLNKTYLARCSFDFKYTCSTPEGQISDFNIWSRALTRKEAEEWTSCRNSLKGDVVNWDKVNLELVNMTEEERNMNTLCVPPRPGHVLFPLKRNFSAHMAICQQLKGGVSVIKDSATMDKLSSHIKSFEQCGNSWEAFGSYWAGWWDETEEGIFSNANTGELLLSDMYQPWYLGEPNGDTLENCASVWSAKGAWNDLSCDATACGYCEFERAPDLQIRGLCSSSKFDTRFSWMWKLVAGRHSFRGFKDTVLQYDPVRDQWRMDLYSTNETYAVTNSTEYPFGLREWEIVGDSCFKKRHSFLTINVNACEDSEFNCDDGNCVPISQRCDGKVQCPDKTDEISCKILSTDRSYLKEVPPPPAQGNFSEVYVQIDLFSILDIHEVDNIITLQYQLELTWSDKRLTMYNLKMDRDLNTLTQGFRNKIWIPEVVFYNTQDKHESQNDGKAFATIAREGKYRQSPRSELENAFTFKGSENPITISRVYDSEFLCDFDMHTYPFDTQKCHIILVMKGNSDKFVHMKPLNLTYLGPIDLTQYFIKKFDFGHFNVLPNKAALKVDIIFGRRVLATILTTYLPTILLCIVCFSTNYFKAFFFEAIVTVNLTALLVLTTLFINIYNSLPATAYVKMIDVWLIFNLFVPFSEVILHTLIDSQREETDREINHHGRTVQVAPASGSNAKDNTNGHPSNQNGKITGKVGKVSHTSFTRDSRLVHRDESLEVAARSRHYRHVLRARDEKVMESLKRVTSVGVPAVYFAFVFVYALIGVILYGRDAQD